MQIFIHSRRHYFKDLAEANNAATECQINSVVQVETFKPPKYD